MSVVQIAREQVVDFEDRQAQVSVAASGLDTTILSFTLKNYFRCFIAFVGDAWDPGMDTYFTKRLKVNGATVYQFRDSTVQWAQPSQPSQEISPWIEVPMGSTILYQGNLSTAGAAGNAVARIRVYYVPLNNNQ